MDINNESGWFYPNDNNHTHDITDDDIEALLRLADIEDQWAENVRKEAAMYDDPARPFNMMELMLQQLRLTNIAGTMVQFPFGYFCTFESRRHLFRGENQVFKHSVPSLGRRCWKNDKRRTDEEIEILHVIANMRIVQFMKFIWQFDIIPQWEGKLSEINYKALAQHYGFETFLLDLTNDVRTALFFATCKWVKDHYEPLTQADIDESEDTKYGVIYHSPDWRIDSLNGRMNLKQAEIVASEGHRNRPSVIDTGKYDGIAYQIGLQPFHRCHTQHGYVYAMKTIADIRDTGDFERLRFRQSVALSNRMFDMMDQGKKIYPEEGIVKALPVIDEIKKSLLFSEDDLRYAYELDEARKDLFPTMECLRERLLSDTTSDLLQEVYSLPSGTHLQIQKDEVCYELDESVKAYINGKYNDRDFLEPLGIKKYYRTPDYIRYRQARHRQIFGYDLDLE
jgi:hypothetical protein